MSAERPVKRAGRRGRKPSKIDQKARLERSRQSARECRARKKLRYQYLEELVLLREKSIFSLREELERVSIPHYSFHSFHFSSSDRFLFTKNVTSWIS